MNNGINYFGLSALSTVTVNGQMTGSAATLTVQQAYQMDKKVDDGSPQTGRVTTQYVNTGSVNWAGTSPGAVATPSSATCYDNGSNTSNPMAYSLSQNNGNGVNCGLSFQFQ